MKNKDTIIRSTKTSLKFSNIRKRSNINVFIDEYHKITQQFIDILWEKKKISSLIPKDITDQVETWLSQRAVQCSAKQASAIIRGTKQKHKQRLYMLKKLQKKGKNTKKLQKKIFNTVLTKPEIDHVNPELDSRFIEIRDSKNSFDIWVKISSIGNHLKFYIPIKKTKHFNKLTDNQFTVKKGIRLSKDKITFNFEKPRPKPTQEQTDTIGIDIGILNVWTASDDTSSKPCPHGHTLSDIQKKLARRKKKSKGFKRAQDHRDNYINWSINQLNLHNINRVRIEDIKDIRRNKRNSRYMSHWSYTALMDKLERLCEEQGVLVDKVDPDYTSQRCSSCGWTRKGNRKGKSFCCDRCNFVCDADLNASRNIALFLPDVRKKRLENLNRIGFYWNISQGQEPIVPDVQKV